MKKYCLNCMCEIEEGTLCADCVHRNIPETTPYQLRPGTMLNGKYLVGNVIGEGALEITYIGRDTVLDTKVVIKEFYPAGRTNRNNEVSSNLIISTEEQRDFIQKGREEFLNEARSIAQFSSEPGIVNVKDFFEENETAYIIMEYLEGKTLAEYIEICGPMNAEKVRELMLPLIRALSKIHKLGVIHRNISPDNIMYLNQGICKLTGFGSAQYFMRQTPELASAVKHGYAPEEQYTSMGKQGPWTDVYGLCATMYKCVTGVTPSDAVDRMANDSLKRPSELGVQIAPEFERTLMYGLALHAQNRCQNMDELLRLMEGNAQPSMQPNYTQPNYAQPGMQPNYMQPNYAQPGMQPNYTQPNYAQPGMQPPKKKNKKILIPIILGGMVFVAAIAFILWNFIGRGGKDVETIGDYYVTGCKDVLKVRETIDPDSKILAKLDNGEKVSLVERTGETGWEVYVEAEDVTGFLDYHYLTNERDAAMEPVTRYVNVPSEDEVSIMNTTANDAAAIGILNRGEEVTVLAMPGDKYAYIYAPNSKAFGYVEQDKLAENKPEDDSDSSAGSNTGASQSLVFGAGAPPITHQGVYFVHVQQGYLALRNAMAFDASNEIGKMYNGDYVLAIQTSGQYWYVYSPALGYYGYTNSDYLQTTPIGGYYSSSSTYYANVASGYLALRNAMAFDASNEIGKIANGQAVEVIDSSTGTYWYVYVPALNKYGYVNSEYLRK